MKKLINSFKGRKELIFIIISLLIIVLLSISPAAASVSDWSFSPQKPVYGDTLKITGSASPGENVDVFVNFEKTVPVSGGKFEYILEDVQIPEGFNNLFKVEAVGVKNLNVRVKTIIWITKSSEASGDTAIVSQSRVPPGNYTIMIDGDAGEGISQVNLKITAFQGIDADPKGDFSYSYNTKLIPPGDFDITVGGITKRVTLLAEEVSNPTKTSFLSMKFTDRVVYVLNHNSDPSEGNWITMGSPYDERRIQVPQPINIRYSGPRFEKYGGVSSNLSTDNDGNYTMNYPSDSSYSTFPVYLPDDKVNMSFFGNSSLKGKVDIYVLNVTSKSAYGIIGAFNTGNLGNLESLFLKSIGRNCTKYSTVLGENGDLLNYSLGSYDPGQYCMVMIQENEDHSLTVLSATAFIVAEHDLHIMAPAKIEKGDNLDISMESEDTPDSSNYTYGAVLVNEQAYRANIEIDSNGTKNGTSLIINGVKVIDKFDINASNYRSKLTKNELQKEIQTLIGDGNGSLALGEPGQKNLSLTTSELPEGHYFLFAGAYDPKMKIAGLTQLDIEITSLPTQTLPVANFISNVTSGYAPLSVQFLDTSENATGRTWDFENDGEIDSTDQNSVNVYTTPGNYTVNLTVSNANGAASKSATINVLEKAKGPYAYITNYFNNTVSIIDTAANIVTDTVNVGSNPLGVAVSPDGANVYVTNWGSSNVSVIDAATNTVIATVNVGKRPYGIAVSPEGSKVYVTNEYSNTVSVIDTGTKTVAATLPVGSWPSGVAVSPDGTAVYVVNEDGTVSVIDAATNNVTATVEVGSNPIAVAVSPDGRKVYVTNYESNNVSVIDTATNTVIAMVEVGSHPGGIAVNPDGSKVYVTNEFSSNVSVIDTATNIVIATVDVGNSLWGVAVSSDGSKVYVANENSNTVSVIDTATNTVTATVKVGSGPIAFGKFVGPVLGPVPVCNTSRIYGYSFNDSNLDKEKNTEEAGLPGMTISLNGYDTCKGRLVSETAKTNSTGYFEFEGADPGVYVISESFVFGWLPTTDAAYTLTVPENSTSIKRDFGNMKFVK